MCGGAIVVVFDDCTLGMIRAKQRAKGYAHEGVDLSQTVFAHLAETLGGIGWQVNTLEEFEGTFKQALASDRFSVIDACLEPQVYVTHLRYIPGTPARFRASHPSAFLKPEGD